MLIYDKSSYDFLHVDALLEFLEPFALLLSTRSYLPSLYLTIYKILSYGTCAVSINLLYRYDDLFEQLESLDFYDRFEKLLFCVPNLYVFEA